VALVVGQGVVAGAVNNQQFNHYSLLATIESLYGLPALGNTAGIATMPFYSALSSPPPPPISPPPPPASPGAVIDWQEDGGGPLASWGMNGAQVTSSATITYQGKAAMPNASWSVAAVGDFNGDGVPDLLWRNQSGMLVDWTMSGSTIISSAGVTMGGTPTTPDGTWSIVGTGDFSGNGKADVLWRSANGSLVDWTMNGSQVMASQQLTLGGAAAAPDSSWSVVGIGDFDGDGKADLLWRNANGSLVEWTMNGAQISSSQAVALQGTPVMPDSSWSVAAIGDFDGDGKADILWRNTNGTLIDWTMNGSQVANVQQVTQGGSPVSIDPSWQVVQVGNFDGNGATDILLRNSNGALEEWSMNGAQIASASQVTFQGTAATPPSAWSILSNPTEPFA
jgi:hypothetical protein